MYIKISLHVIACSTLTPMQLSMAGERYTNGLSLNCWPNAQVDSQDHQQSFCIYRNHPYPRKSSHASPILKLPTPSLLRLLSMDGQAYILFH